MPFKRQWDDSCPRVWDQWEVGQKKLTIEDLDPSDDVEALNLLMTQFVKEEVLNEASGLIDDEQSMNFLAKAWPRLLAERMSLACYVEENGKRELAGVNCCVVTGKADDPYPDFSEFPAFLNLHTACKIVKERVDAFEMLGTDSLHSGRGLVVKADYRGAGIATRIIAARKPLCLSQGISASDTVFTNAAAQRSAEKCGYVTVASASLKELAELGLKYRSDDERVIKYMVNHFKDQQIMEDIRKRYEQPL